VFPSALIAGFLAGFSPFWGLLIIIAYGFRHYEKKNYAYFGVFAVAAIVSVTLITTGKLPLAIMDTFWGVGLTAYVFFYYLNSSHNYHTALMLSSGNGLLYGIIRQMLFRQVIMDQISESSTQSLELMKEMFADNLEMLSLAEQSTQTSLSFFQNYGTAIWFMVTFFAIYLSSLWLSARTKTNWKHALFCLPYWSAYLLIAAMVFFLIPVTRTAGTNLLLIITPCFFIQGIAISNYFWKVYAKNNRFVFFFLISVILLNYVLILSLVILGIADLWLMFRQKHQAKLKSM
jgi:predicted membrane protein DUF2232